jgi:hypothetical protein
MVDGPLKPSELNPPEFSFGTKAGHEGSCHERHPRRWKIVMRVS